MSGVSSHENQPNFERLYHNFLKEEGKINSISGLSNEENPSLATRQRKKRSFPFRIIEEESQVTCHKSYASTIRRWDTMRKIFIIEEES